MKGIEVSYNQLGFHIIYFLWCCIIVTINTNGIDFRRKHNIWLLYMINFFIHTRKLSINFFDDLFQCKLYVIANNNYFWHRLITTENEKLLPTTKAIRYKLTTIFNKQIMSSEKCNYFRPHLIALGNIDSFPRGHIVHRK